MKPSLLAELRNSFNWTQNEVVTRLHAAAARRNINVGVDAQMLSKWERGKKTPSKIYRTLLGDVYNLPDSSWTPVDPINARQIAELRQHAHELNRMLDEALPRDLTSSDTQPLDYLERLLRDCRALDDHHGSSIGLQIVRRELLPSIERAIRKASPSERRRTAQLLSSTAQLAGWLAIDIEEADIAKQFLWAAQAAAEEAQDPSLFAFAAGTYAHALCLEGNFQSALDRLASASHAADRATSPRLRAWIQAVQARAYAGAGDGSNSQQSLDLGSKILDAGSDQDDLPWMEFFNKPQLKHWEGYSNLLLGDGVKALASLQRALDGTPNDFARERTILYADIALSYAIQGQTDNAVANARLAMKHGRPSPRLNRRLQSILDVLRGPEFSSALTSDLQQFIENS